MERPRLILDSGALSALASRQKPVRALIERVLLAGGDLVVPSVVVAESTVGDGRDASINVVLKAIGVDALDEPTARAAGRLRAKRRLARGGTIDAIVIATADDVPGSSVLTGDPDDLRPLASEQGRTTVVGL